MKVSFAKRDNRIMRVYSPNLNYENNDWLQVYWNKKLGFCFTLSLGGYFDPRVEIHVKFLWLQIFWHLPIKTKYNDCETPTYGIMYYTDNHSFWIYRGRKIKMIAMPWQYDWVRTSALLKDGTWAHESKSDRKDFWSEPWKSLIKYETFPYAYKLKSGKVQNVTATIHVKQREWRQRWLKWTSWLAHTNQCIEIDFSDEVGEQAGSWKGGCVGCSYNMLPNEKPEETLRRMEKEREFK